MNAEAVPKTQKTLFGHPIGLYILFFTEMWERFSFYGMRSLLKLYMVNYLFVTSRQFLQGGKARIIGDPSLIVGWDFIHKYLLRGEMNAGANASVLYGWYGSLVYLTPLLGGYLADRYWGQRKAVYIGGMLMAIGQFALVSDNLFFFGLLFLILGNGAFKPNISTQVGSLYPPGDPRRDGAFTIFYMGINIGFILCSFICASLAAVKGWRYGFASAGVGMITGLVIYTLGGKYLVKDRLTIKKSEEKKSVAIVKKQPLTSNEWKCVRALLGLVVINIVFWATYEQQGNIVQTWADTKIAWPTILGFKIPSTWFQMFNAWFIILLAPFLDMFWRWQAKKGKESSSVVKMATGCITLAIGFVVIAIGAHSLGTDQGSFFWLIVVSFFITVAELYLSPIGLSLVTKVSPVRIVSMMMGIWFLGNSGGLFLNGYIGILYEKAILTPTQFFLLCAAMVTVAGIAIATFQGPLKNAMDSGKHH